MAVATGSVDPSLRFMNNDELPLKKDSYQNTRNLIYIIKRNGLHQ